MATTPFWRKFEHFVAGLEQALAPVGAVVTSPDSILDRVTGGFREMDASIRYLAGPVDVLFTVECRYRSRTQDINWIEQLVAMLNDIGAARTIEVTTQPLSSGARKKAASPRYWPWSAARTSTCWPWRGPRFVGGTGSCARGGRRDMVPCMPVCARCG